MEAMSCWERVTAALAGGPVDRPPVSVWQHFPERDQRAEQLAEATCEWQQRYACDFVKLMPPGDYPTIDWGGESLYRGSPGGTRETVHFPVAQLSDWATITPVPVDRGMNREVIGAAQLVDQRLGGTVPVLQTIFGPLTTAMKLSAGRVLDHLRQEPALVHRALAVIAQVTGELTTATLAQGASGIFFATQCATTELMTAEEYEEFGARYDRAVLDAASASRFTLLHIHGEQILFEALASYPVHAINWHDRRTSPSLAEGRAIGGHCVVGGLDEHAFPAMTADEAAAQARDAVVATGGRGVIIAPGCVLPQTTPAANIEAALAAVRGA